MARSRNIKPGFFTNDLIAEMTPWARLLFIGMWTIADKDGRMEYRPKKIKMEIFPGDSIEVEPLIDELVSHGFVERYTSDGVDVLSVINFRKHQNPHPKEKDSELPAKKPVTAGSHVITRQVTESPEQAEELHKPSGLIPDSLISDSPTPATKTRRKKDELSEDQQAKFDRWYAEYPRKVDKAAAVKAWGNITPAPDDALVDSMIAKVREWAVSHEWTKDGGEFVPYPATWLNRSRWTDGAPAQSPGSLTSHQGGQYGQPREIERPDLIGPERMAWERERYAKRQAEAEAQRASS